MKIKGVIEDLKLQKKVRMVVKIIKICLELSLVLLWAVWGQLSFGQFLDPAYISQDLQSPSYVFGTNYRVLIYCTCHVQGDSLCFSFCLVVSSVSNFRPDTRKWWWTLFQAHLSSHAVGKEGRCKQITLVCSHSVSHTGLPLLMACVLSLSTLLRLQVALQGTF